MTYVELVHMTRLYCRDNNSYVFTDAQIKLFLNQAIDRLRQYKVFRAMPYLSDDFDVPKILPEPYHYMLALFASHRCYDMDERFYEGVEKRNEFEQLLEWLIADVQSGNLVLMDGDGEDAKPIEDGTTYIDHVKNVYFHPIERDDAVGGEVDADTVS